MSDAGVSGRLRRTAADVFGWRELRPGQSDAMEAVMAGQDTLEVMPTGGARGECGLIGRGAANPAFGGRERGKTKEGDAG
ncbi:hypothetical protein [Streptomyces sp. NPDC047706]|uniref:hypothetical protein n=1 Tax=Streptomyces sp. NPDC047706 TaxID=3365486 RepID=UPI00372049CA